MQQWSTSIKIFFHTLDSSMSTICSHRKEIIFKYLRVIAEVHQGKYLMPCLLRVDSRPILLSTAASTVIPPLHFYFGPGGPKLRIYCFLLASLVTDAKWELMSEYDHPMQPLCNRVQFVLPGWGENPGCITIFDSLSTFFHVSITFPEDITLINGCF